MNRERDQQQSIEFDATHKEYWRYIYTICKAYLRHEEDTLDAVNEVFIKVWLSYASYDPVKAPLRIFLRQIAVNTCIDTLRRKHWTEQPHDGREAGPNYVGDEGSIKRIALAQCLQTLPPDERCVLLMKHLDGYSWQEIEEITGFTIAQARYREARARALLQSMLGNDGNDTSPS